MTLAVQIPKNADILLKVGQIVDFETPLYTKRVTGSNSIPIADILQFEPGKIFLKLKKMVGEKVKKGDLLAEHKSFLTSKQYFSEFDGIIQEINHQVGTILLTTETEDTDTLLCYFKGEVAAIHEGFIELKVKHFKEYEIITHESYFGCQVYYHTPEESIAITEELVKDKAIVVKEIKPYELVKLEALGAKGLIAHTEIMDIQTLPVVQIKEPTDFLTLAEHKFPYCIKGPNHNTIYFYE